MPTQVFRPWRYNYLLSGSASLAFNTLNQYTFALVLQPYTTVTLNYRWNFQWTSDATIAASQVTARYKPIGAWDIAPYSDTAAYDLVPTLFKQGSAQIVKVTNNEPFMYNGYCERSSFLTNVTFVDQVFFSGNTNFTLRNLSGLPTAVVLTRSVQIGFNRPVSGTTHWRGDVTNPYLLWNCNSKSNSKTIGQTVLGTVINVAGLDDGADFIGSDVNAGWGLFNELDNVV